MNNDMKNAGADALASKDGLGIVIQTLNEAFQADPNAICALIAMRVPCNQKLADHPTIQVGGQPDMVGMLGIINGVVERMTGKRVAAIYGDDSKLEGFKEYQNQPIIQTDKMPRKSSANLKAQKASSSATCSPASSDPHKPIKIWLVPHLEGFFGPRERWTEAQTDKYHELLGLIYCYESEKQENAALSHAATTQKDEHAK